MAWAVSPLTMVVPAQTMVVGIPATPKRTLKDAAVAEQRVHALRYAELAKRHAEAEP